MSTAVTHTAPPSTETIRLRLAAMLPELRREHGVCSVALFGSYARGEQTSESDLDLLVEFDPLPDLFALIELEIALGDRLGIAVEIALPDEIKRRARPFVFGDLSPIAPSECLG